MRARILSRLVATTVVSTLGLFAVGAVSASAGPPVVNQTIVTRDTMVTIGPDTTGCPEPGVDHIDLVLHEVFHLTLTDTTFHFGDKISGTFTSIDGSGNVVASGRVTNNVSDQGPGFPREAFTSVINATGKRVDGSKVMVRVRMHVTVRPDGTLSSDFSRLSCI
jgi:hypothetical protein